MSGGDPLTRKRDEERAAEKKKKEAAQKLEEEQKALFRPVMTQRVASGMTFVFLLMTAIIKKFLNPFFFVCTLGLLPCLSTKLNEYSYMAKHCRL